MKLYIIAILSFFKKNFLITSIICFSIILTIASSFSFLFPVFYIFLLSTFFLIYNFTLVIFKSASYVLLKLSISSYINNIKIDIDNTTNTDGEDLLSYLNDFTEISLQDRAYFFDWIFTNPFEFMLYSSLSYIFVNLILKGYQRVTISVFKFIKK